jgi:hypothetical protein
MLSPSSVLAKRFVGRALTAAAALLFASGLALAPSASAGTYPMYQCAPSIPAVSPGWSVYGINTNASTVLWNTCSTGGAIGDYVSSNEQAGAVTESANSGSQVGLMVAVPGSAPDVTIQSIHAEVIASSVTGDDAWLGFSSTGQSLSGLTELPYGGGGYTNSERWTLPQGARDFEAYVNCSTDRSSPTCNFSDAIAVPALTDVTLTLADSTAPVLTSVSGPLATAAAAKASITGSQAISFVAGDADSGVRSATLTLSPQSGGAPSIHTFDFSSLCAYDAWNACPVTQTVSGFALNTIPLKDDTYAVSLAITDAAGNVINDALGSVTVSNPVATVSSLGALPGPGTSSGSSTGAGSPNGTAASEGAHLQLGARSPILRAYAKRAVRITGRLLNARGLPIVGASLDVLEQIEGSTLELIGHARTGTNGTFVATVPGGPSRMVEIGYRAFSADGAYSASARVLESVRAGVKLSVSPRRTGSQGTITLSGRVLGPVPAQGVVVELLVHYRGRWEPFRDPRTDSRGRFHVVYRFQGGIGRFPFRALVFGSQGGFPFALGESRAVNVTTR